MTLFRNRYRVESARMPGWDYSSPGCYFLTVVTKDRQPLFGEIHDGIMVLSEIGIVVLDEWIRSAEIRREIRLDQFAIMPDHFHAIVWIVSDSHLSHYEPPVETHGRASQRAGVAYRSPKSISSLMAGFKSACTVRINELRRTPHQPVWQPRFWDRIIRDENELDRTRRYILRNPINWTRDHEGKAQR